jgi:hypothetical protein
MVYDRIYIKMNTVLKFYQKDNIEFIVLMFM